MGKEIKVSAVITAAGQGIRFGANKMLVKIAGKPLLAWTVRAFSQCPDIKEIIVVGQEKELASYGKVLKKENLMVKLVKGGKERVISCYLGVKEAKEEVVITHDGARPMTSPKLIHKVVLAAKKYGACLSAEMPTATIKYVPKEDLLVEKTLVRKNTWIAQTPQGFKREIILKAFERAIKNKEFEATDDSEFVTKLGYQVRIVPGEPENIKITYPKDVILAEQILKQKYGI